jgi:hypothetical protein
MGFRRQTTLQGRGLKFQEGVYQVSQIFHIKPVKFDYAFFEYGFKIAYLAKHWIHLLKLIYMKPSL